MNRTRLFAIGTLTLLMVALIAVAQQTANKPSAHGKDNVPNVEGHLKALAEKLDLTADEQVKIKPVLQELHDDTLKLVQDESLSREERLDKVRNCRHKADKKIREIINDDQKKKLDQLEQGPHPELHGNISGTTQTAPERK